MQRTLDAAASAIEPIIPHVSEEVRRNINLVYSETLRLEKTMREAMEPHKEIRYAS
jgi:hypothetical protein